MKSPRESCVGRGSQKEVSKGDRGISTPVTYVLTLVTTTLLISGLFVGATSFVDTYRQQTIHSEFEVLGNRVAADVAAVDRLVQTTEGTSTIRRNDSLPQYIADVPYQINVTATAAGPQTHDVALEFYTTSPSVNATVTLKTRTAVENTTIPGGNMVVTYDQATNKLEIKHG